MPAVLAGILLLFILGTKPAQAVPPPDFVFAVGSQLAQVFSLLAIVLGAAASVFARVAKPTLGRFKHKRLVVAGVIVSILAISITGAYEYDSYLQRQAYDEWLAESAAHATPPPVEQPSTPAPVPEPTPILPSFFDLNQSIPEPISNADFAAVEHDPNTFVLDAREDEEVAIGRYPGSTHIRYADLVDGAWNQLPTDRIIYVFCWSGIRGKEAADFLRSEHLVARYLENGASGWVSSGGSWDGEINFSKGYPAPQYAKLVALDELKTDVANGAVLVDSRTSTSYASWHIPGSLNIPIIYTPTSQMDAALAQVPASAPVITICDDFVSCFDAKMGGMKLEALGHVFIGRYNKPWEYRAAP